MQIPWWSRHRGRLEDELERLKAAGVAYAVDEEARAHGLLRLDLTVQVPAHGPLQLRASFPDLYPYTRPEVDAPGLSMPHHQHPFGKNLCLLGRSTRYWAPHDTLAGLLDAQLDRALAAGTAHLGNGVDVDALSQIEEQQGEPFSHYYSYIEDAMLLIDGSWRLPDGVGSGDINVGISSQPPSPRGEGRLLGAVLAITDDSGNTLLQADELSAKFPHVVKGRWTRRAEPVRDDSAEAVWTAAESADARTAPVVNGPGKERFQLRALVFPEEVAWRASGDGYVFVLRVPHLRHLSKKQKSKRRHPALATTGDHYLVRAGRAGPADLAARVPELGSLPAAKVVVAGVGALGSPILDKLAQAGVGSMACLDGDVLEPGNLVRHAARFDMVGLRKSVVGGLIAQERSPYVETSVAQIRLGGVRADPGQPSDVETLAELLDGAHLLVDATAELGLQQALADAAATRQIPYLCVTATNGGWGGMVALVQPGRTEGCYLCLLHHLSDGGIPLPPESPTDLVQPPGCASPTFTGAGFDLDEVALQATRMAVGVLSVGKLGGYSAPAYDVGVLALRDNNGHVIAPRWSTHQLTHHGKCPAH